MSRGATRTVVLVAVLLGLVALVVTLVPLLSGPATATPGGTPAPATAPSPSAAPAAPVDLASGLRVMTWNVRTNTFDAPDWAPVVAEQQPDVVAFQEICAGDAEDLVALLRDEHGLDYEMVPGPAREALYETCRDTADGPVVFGQAVLSRVPLRDPVTTILPDGGNLDEPRALLAVTLDLPGTPVRLLTTHITVASDTGDDAAKSARRRALQAEQIEVVAQQAARGGQRVVALGDFNLVPDDPRLDVIADAGLRDVDADRNAPTGGNNVEDPGSAADAKIDYVFVKGLQQVGEPETFWVAGSDHRPLVATLRP